MSETYDPTHDPEPWTVTPVRPGDKWVTIPEPAIRVDNDDVPDGVGPANAARVVACVNACAGLADPGEAVAMLVTLARDLCDVWCQGGDLGALHVQIRDAAELLPWPTDACWGCGESLLEKGSVEAGCCANCARVVESPAREMLR